MSLCIVKIKANWHTEAPVNMNGLMRKVGSTLWKCYVNVSGCFYSKNYLVLVVVFSKTFWNQQFQYVLWINYVYRRNNYAEFIFFFMKGTNNRLTVVRMGKGLHFFKMGVFSSHLARNGFPTYICLLQRPIKFSRIFHVASLTFICGPKSKTVDLFPALL